MNKYTGAKKTDVYFISVYEETDKRLA